MNRLKELLHQRIERVQVAEIKGEWNIKTIKLETEFLLNVQNLILEYESLFLKTLIVQPPEPPQEIELRDTLIRSLLIELMAIKVSGLPMFTIDFTIKKLIEYRKLNVNGSNYLTKIAIEDYCKFHLKTAPIPEKEYLISILNHLDNEKTINK